MKKLILPFLMGAFLFAANTSDIDKKLDLILNKIDILEKKVDQKDKEIQILKKQLQKEQQEIKHQKQQTKKQFALKNCKNLKVVSFKYKYYDDVLPYYIIEVTLKNNYPYTVTKINGNIFFDDKNDGTTFLKVFIKRNVNIKPQGEITIKREYMITSTLEKELKDEKPSDLNVYFSATKLNFQNGQKMECF